MDANFQKYGKAYRVTAERYDLKGFQRTALDSSPLYVPIMEAAKTGAWDRATGLLFEAGIISLAQVIHISE